MPGIILHHLLRILSFWNDFFPTDLAMDILCPCFLHAMKISRPPRILLIRGSPRGPICNCTTQQSNFKYLRNHPVLFLDTFWPTKIPLVFKILLSNIQHWMRLVIALCMIFTILLTLWNSEQKNRLLIKLFCFSSDFDETWWSCSYPCVLQFHQVSSKSDEKQKSFINSPFFCSEFQSVSRIVKIVHSAIGGILCNSIFIRVFFPRN